MFSQKFINWMQLYAVVSVVKLYGSVIARWRGSSNCFFTVTASYILAAKTGPPLLVTAYSVQILPNTVLPEIFAELNFRS